jgi:hypothetical protein
LLRGAIPATITNCKNSKASLKSARKALFFYMKPGIIDLNRSWVQVAVKSKPKMVRLQTTKWLCNLIFVPMQIIMLRQLNFYF